MDDITSPFMRLILADTPSDLLMSVSISEEISLGATGLVYRPSCCVATRWRPGGPAGTEEALAVVNVPIEHEVLRGCT